MPPACGRRHFLRGSSHISWRSLGSWRLLGSPESRHTSGVLRFNYNLSPGLALRTGNPPVEAAQRFRRLARYGTWMLLCECADKGIGG